MKVDDIKKGTKCLFSDDNKTWVEDTFNFIHYYDRRVYQTESGKLYEMIKEIK